jgi:peptide/nickel transport system substrate-binding protein
VSTGIVLAVIMTMIVAACGSSSSKAKGQSGAGPATTQGVSGNTSDNSKPTPGGSIKFALEAESSGGWCLPEAQLAISGIQVARAIYDYLAVPDNAGNYVPSLADKITPNANSTVWTIHLRSGITFHDGTPLNAQVVADNLNAYRGTFPQRKPLLFIFVFTDIKSVTVTDPMTVTVRMNTPWATFPSSLYSYGRLGIMAEKQLHDGSNCFKDMIGTGPFEFHGDWVLNDHLTVVRNPHYWRKDSFGQQLPYLDKITFNPVPETATLINGLEASPPQFDLAETDNPPVINQLQSGPVSSGGMGLLKSGVNPEVAYNLFNVSKPPFNNIIARQAFAYAINADEYNRIANYNLLQRATGPFGPGTLGYLKDTGLPNYDPAKAKTLVQQYTSAVHQPLSFTYQTTNDPVSLTNAQLIQKYVQAAGMSMNIKQVDEATLINYAIAGSFQVSAWRNHPGFDPDTQFVWWHCSAKPGAAAGSTNIGVGTSAVAGNNCDNAVNFSRFNDAEINKDLDTGRSSSDPAVRKAAYEDLNREFAKQLWEAWGYWSLWTLPYQNSVRGLIGPNLPTATSPDATGATPFQGLSSGTDVSGIWLKK